MPEPRWRHSSHRRTRRLPRPPRPVPRKFLRSNRLWLLLVLGLYPCLYPAARAHDTITTKLTWNREISRIVYSRCIGCHRPGGQAFSLLTYAEARPWAKAISEEVLERRMPPWGAVKGFGDFRNDQSLSLEQLDWIAHWVDGGAPEGDPKDLPARPRSTNASANALAAPARQQIFAQNGFVVDRAIVLDGLLPQAIPAGASAQITAELPGGAIVPLVWLYNYQARYGHPFLLRTPIGLPRGAVLRGIPPESRIELWVAAKRIAATAKR
jgi:hypothetical protein